MCELLVGLPDVNVLAVDDTLERLTVVIEVRGPRPLCLGCGVVARVKDRDKVLLVDLPVFGRPSRLLWRKYRWKCITTTCPMLTWTTDVPSIAASRLALTDRAGRWVTRQVGQHGRSVSDVANELDCDWHTVNNAVQAYGAPLVDDPARIGAANALGLDETLFVREGERNHKQGVRDVAAAATMTTVPRASIVRLKCPRELQRGCRHIVRVRRGLALTLTARRRGCDRQQPRTRRPPMQHRHRTNAKPSSLFRVPQNCPSCSIALIYGACVPAAFPPTTPR